MALAQEARLPALSSAPIKDGLPEGAFSVSRSDCHSSPRKTARLLLSSLVLAGSLLCVTPALADQAPNPELERLNAQREQILHRERMLLLFPAAVLGITIALIIIKRRK
jgi:hypothetical protein